MWSLDNTSPHSFDRVNFDEGNGLVGDCVQKDDRSYLMVSYDNYEKKILPGKENHILLIFNFYFCNVFYVFSTQFQGNILIFMLVRLWTLATSN